MLPRSRALSGLLAEAGKSGLTALSAGLSPVERGGALERACHEDAGRVHRELVRVVSFSAFHLLAEARGLVPAVEAEALKELGARMARELSTCFRLDAALLERLRRALSEKDGEKLDYAALQIEELGSVYEGMLGMSCALAERACVVLSPPRKAGSEPRGVVVEAAKLLALAAEQRTAFLRRHAVPVGRRLARRIAGARAESELERIFAEEHAPPSLAFAAPGSLYLRVTGERRRTGSHYTPRAVAAEVVAETLAPLIPEDATPEAILALRVCDPACGSGAFLLAACEFLAGRLLAAENVAAPTAAAVFDARRRIADRCLYGVDANPQALELARWSLELLTGSAQFHADTSGALRVGDAVVSRERKGSLVAGIAFDWRAEFPEVFAEGRGFDAFIGNPPWVSYVGRAAQPLAPARRRYYLNEYASFAGYRNLQGLFVERSAHLLRGGGRLGFVLPSSMAELDGYRPTRVAHDELCESDTELTELPVSAFDGVFQPAMVLVSTRRAGARRTPPGGPWPLERPDLDELARRLLEKLDVPPLPASLFGERGLQTTGDDTLHLGERSDERHLVPLRSGADIAPFRRHPPSQYADPSWFGERLRDSSEWRRVRILIRQTARAPLAALSDGEGFRNSILAGFEDDAHPAEFLVAYLNSTLVRWLHFMRHRDARHGMPQLKIGHLRATPAPPRASLVATLAELGRQYSRRNVGIEREEQRQLDDLVCDAFDLEAGERDRIYGWAQAVGGTAPAR
jgi:hypothetical protein